MFSLLFVVKARERDGSCLFSGESGRPAAHGGHAEGETGALEVYQALENTLLHPGW